MSRRILVALPNDPTLAAQAHAAILAVPGVDVEEVGTHAGLGLTTGAALDMLPHRAAAALASLQARGRIGGAWAAGMRTTDGEIVVDVLDGVPVVLCRTAGGVIEETAPGARPDTAHAPTVGALLALAREAHADPCVTVVLYPGFDTGPDEWACVGRDGIRVGERCDSEAEALVAALEAAT